MAEFKDRLEEALKLRDMKPAELARENFLKNFCKTP